MISVPWLLRRFSSILLMIVFTNAISAAKTPSSLQPFFCEDEIQRIHADKDVQSVWTRAELPMDVFLPPEIRDHDFDYVILAKGELRSQASFVDLANTFLSVSELKGLPYFSVTENKMLVLIKDCYRVAGPDNPARLPDTSVTDVKAISFYFHQFDNRGGNMVYWARIRQMEDGSILYTAENIQSLSKFGVKVLSPGDDYRCIRAFRRGDTYLYFAAHRIKLPGWAPKKPKTKESLLNRLRALMGFYRSQLEH